MSAGRHVWVRRGALGCAALVAVSVVARGARHDVFTQDTTAIIDGVHRIASCLHDGVRSACGFHPGTQTTDVNPYPLLQYLPAAVLAGLGFDDAGVRTGLIWCNTAAVVLTVGLVVLRARRIGGGRHAVVAAALVATGMLVPYAGHSFGEPLVVLAGTVLTLQCLVERTSRWSSFASSPGAVAAVAALGAVGKETLFVSLALFAAAALLVARHERSEARRRAIAVGVGLLAGVVANFAFNGFRFGGITNVQYLRETRPGIGAAAANTASLLVAPNGGLVWFWFGAAVAVAALVVAVARPGVEVARDRWGAAAALAGFSVGLGSLGLWWGPFGWYSWGPRLLLPFVVPVIVVALELWAPSRRAAAWRRLSPVHVALVAVPIGLLMVPALGDVWNREAWTSMQVASMAERPGCATVDIGDGRPYAPFHECLMDAAWRIDHPPLVDTITTMPDGERVWFWCTAVVALASLGLGAAWVSGARAEPCWEPGDRFPAGSNAS